IVYLVRAFLRVYFVPVSRFCLFFFSSRRRHTRFKCDWSSDVCSSDLPGSCLAPPTVAGPGGIDPDEPGADQAAQAPGPGLTKQRSEERRVGKECRSRWAQ